MPPSVTVKHLWQTKNRAASRLDAKSRPAPPFRRCCCRIIIRAFNVRGDPMDKQLVAALVRAAGLEKALAEFPDDVMAAAEQSLNNAGAVKVPTDPAAEPWPPMRAGVGL